MPDTTKPNPVTRRVERLSNQWLDFALNPQARLLCWGLASDEQRMLEAFFALELDERSAQHDDLFLPLRSAFASNQTYGRALRDELVELYRKDQEGLRAEGVEASWEAPEPLESEASLALLVRTCSSFATQHALP